MVPDPPELQNWDVEVATRVEGVTDHASFADRCEEALAREDGSSILRVNRLAWPHATSFVERLAATDKMDAEEQLRHVFLRVILAVTRESLGNESRGWTMRMCATRAEYETTSK
jgi:hypothetical protein